jgi:phosphopantetheinyl transferase (holo-ACP synthase)
MVRSGLLDRLGASVSIPAAAAAAELFESGAPSVAHYPHAAGVAEKLDMRRAIVTLTHEGMVCNELIDGPGASVLAFPTLAPTATATLFQRGELQRVPMIEIGNFPFAAPCAEKSDLRRTKARLETEYTDFMRKQAERKEALPKALSAERRISEEMVAHEMEITVLPNEIFCVHQYLLEKQGVATASISAALVHTRVGQQLHEVEVSTQAYTHTHKHRHTHTHRKTETQINTNNSYFF